MKGIAHLPSSFWGRLRRHPQPLRFVAGRGLDGPYLPTCPRRCRAYCADTDKCQPQGLARLSGEPGRTVLDFWDRTVDSRGGSHSLFILPPGLDFAEAVRVARLHFPDIWARLDAAGVVVRLR